MESFSRVPPTVIATGVLPAGAKLLPAYIGVDQCRLITQCISAPSCLARCSIPGIRLRATPARPQVLLIGTFDRLLRVKPQRARYLPTLRTCSLMPYSCSMSWQRCAAPKEEIHLELFWRLSMMCGEWFFLNLLRQRPSPRARPMVRRIAGIHRHKKINRGAYCRVT